MAPQPILNPELPYVGEVEGGLTSGKMVRVQGQVPVDSTSFAINYQLGPSLNPRDDIALHVSPKFNDEVIVRNHIQSMTWGREESNGPMWIERGTHFEIIIFCDYQCYKIAVNGKHFAEFSHRIPYNRVTHLVIDGAVEISYIFYETVSVPKPSAPITDDPINIGPPVPGGLYPTLNAQEKQGPPADADALRNHLDGHSHQSKPQKSDEQVFSGLDKVGLAVGGLVAAGSVAAAVHAYKKNKKKNKPEGDYQNIKTSKSESGLGGLGTLGAVLAGTLASNAFKDKKVYSQQGYPQPDAKSDVFSSILGALGGAAGKYAGQQNTLNYQPQSNLLGEALGGVFGGASRRQQYTNYPPSGAYADYPPNQDSQRSNSRESSSGLGGGLFKSAIDGLSSHVSQKVEKKLAKELSKSIKNQLNLTPRKA